MVDFYCTCIRSVLECSAQVFHHSLPIYLSDDLERVQKRALSIISPGESYKHNLDRFNLSTLFHRREDLCCKVFNGIQNDPTSINYMIFYLQSVRKIIILETIKFLVPYV